MIGITTVVNAALMATRSKIHACWQWRWLRVWLNVLSEHAAGKILYDGLRRIATRASKRI